MALETLNKELETLQGLEQELDQELTQAIELKQALELELELERDRELEAKANPSLPCRIEVDVNAQTFGFTAGIF